MKYILFILTLSSFVWSNIGHVGAVKGSAELIRNINTLSVKSGMQL